MGLECSERRSEFFLLEETSCPLGVRIDPDLDPDPDPDPGRPSPPTLAADAVILLLSLSSFHERGESDQSGGDECRSHELL